METEEQALRRKYEDLRVTLENRTRELSQFQELYSKLKQRVIGSGIPRSHTPVQGAAAVDPTHGRAQSQLPRPIMPLGARTGVPNYFPASPGYPKSQPNLNAVAQWNKPAFAQLSWSNAG
ncbi:50fc2991-50e5-44a9-8cf7-a27fee9fcc6f [Thermothielavioides terrestris]|uniref:50fc2991-50e5-44a9-8cf7-a27fee9fcc6f n=1 Tax=Thermothielavioides terrestris TaxID=2587410 RepID=A0A446BBY5_9PEZI|nr:50fc2991-50e5-44a9-8cf7-a27fee9fcc6f [Thermothielavioides terrestris]